MSSPPLRTTTCLALCLWASTGCQRHHNAPSPRTRCPACRSADAAAVRLRHHTRGARGRPDRLGLDSRGGRAGAHSCPRDLATRLRGRAPWRAGPPAGGPEPEAAAQALDTLAASPGPRAASRCCLPRARTSSRCAVTPSSRRRPLLPGPWRGPSKTVLATPTRPWANAAMALAEVGDAHCVAAVVVGARPRPHRDAAPESGLAARLCMRVARRGGADDVGAAEWATCDAPPSPPWPTGCARPSRGATSTTP